MEQIELPLNDKQKKLEYILSTYVLYTGQSLHITRNPNTGNFWVMERTYNSYDRPDYTYLFNVSYEDAKWIVEKRVFGKNVVTDWFNCVAEYKEEI